jgi:hypothetical protein
MDVRLNAPGATLEASGGAPVFQIFSARNPLKSLDSEKKMKANESYFPFICLLFLTFSFAKLALRLHRTRRDRGAWLDS